METEKNWENQDVINRQKLEAAVNELNDFLTQIRSINNILNLLYSFLRGEQREIAEPSSAMLVCMVQLDYICRKSDELLDIILDCSGTAKQFV